MTIDSHTPPLIIIGLDAADPDLMMRWAAEGYMPTLASLMQRGCWAHTAGPELICEHGIWVSLSSGVPRSWHGYHYFRQLKPGTYDLENVTGADINALPFWSYLRGRNKRVAVVDVPDAFPIKDLPGIQLTDWATHNPPDFASAEPASLLRDVRRIFGPQMKIYEKLRSGIEDDRKLYRQLMDRVEKKGELCRALLAGNKFDLTIAVFAESHTATHQFWKYYRRAASQHNGEVGSENELTHAVRNIYAALDRQVALLLEQLPDDANIFVVSSTGMEDHYPTTHLIEDFCRKLGYQASPNGAARPKRAIDLLRRAMPESWRVRLSQFLPRERREALLADQFRSATDWERTTAFAIPSAYMSYVRVNLRGREPQGIVEPGAEYEALLDRLTSDLEQLVDPRTGQRAVREVTRTKDVFGEESLSALPDLFVAWTPCSHFRESVVHPKMELTQKEPEFFRDNDHTQRGFIAAAGPGIHARGALPDISLLDLAPTFLALLGEPRPPEMTGKSILLPSTAQPDYSQLATLKK
ncbi:MAG: alkaline phosphatase family protein [Pyrinomonadaceae bacterium]|nr:alkaline phosphatase family protein [Pyrinomonadaceae bacterium]